MFLISEGVCARLMKIAMAAGDIVRSGKPAFVQK